MVKGLTATHASPNSTAENGKEKHLVPVHAPWNTTHIITPEVQDVWYPEDFDFWLYFILSDIADENLVAISASKKLQENICLSIQPNKEFYYLLYNQINGSKNINLVNGLTILFSNKRVDFCSPNPTSMAWNREDQNRDPCRWMNKAKGFIKHT